MFGSNFSGTSNQIGARTFVTPCALVFDASSLAFDEDLFGTMLLRAFFLSFSVENTTLESKNEFGFWLATVGIFLPPLSNVLFLPADGVEDIVGVSMGGLGFVMGPTESNRAFFVEDTSESESNRLKVSGSFAIDGIVCDCC